MKNILIQDVGILEFLVKKLQIKKVIKPEQNNLIGTIV